jgi:AI-2 transport protein TqsA
VVSLFQLKLKLPQAFSILLSFGLIGLILAALIGLLFISARDFAAGAGIYQQKAIDAATQIAGQLEAFNIKVDQETIRENFKDLPIFSVIRNITSSLVGFLGNSILISIFVLFLITGSSSIKENAHNSLAAQITRSVRNYVNTKFLTSSATGLIITIILMSFNLDLAILLGMLTFLLNFIPSIGSLIAVALPLPIAFLQFGFGLQFFAILAIPAAVQITIGNILEPKFMGKSLGLHPVALLFALMFWGIVWGIPGMFLAGPITAIIKIVTEKIDVTKPFAKLLGGEF